MKNNVRITIPSVRCPVKRKKCVQYNVCFGLTLGVSTLQILFTLHYNGRSNYNLLPISFVYWPNRGQKSITFYRKNLPRRSYAVLWACRLFVCMFCGRSSAETSSAVWKVRVCSRFPTLVVVQVHWWLVSSLIFAPLRVTLGRIFANIILDCCMNCNTLLTYKSSLSTVFVCVVGVEHFKMTWKDICIYIRLFFPSFFLRRSRLFVAFVHASLHVVCKAHRAHGTFGR